MKNPAPPQSGITFSKTSLLGFAAAIGLVVLITAALNFRVALSATPAPKAPLTVETVVYTPQTNYDRSVSFLGLVVAGRKANLGFQIPGIIATPPLREGTPVSRGDTIASLDQTALSIKHKATEAELQQARIELDLAQLKATRQKKLNTTGAVSEEMFDETRLRALALQSRVDAVAAQLASIDDELEKSLLLAPYDGVIADRYVHQGAVINAGTPVVRLLQSADQESHIGVPAERASELQPGRAYSLKLRDKTFQSTLLSVRPDIDPVTRTALAVFALPSASEALDGEPVTLQLSEKVTEPGGWLPVSALLEGSRGLWTVLRIEHGADGARTVREAVEVLDMRGEAAYVRGTLPAGVTVVATGVHRISPGALVSPTGAN